MKQPLVLPDPFAVFPVVPGIEMVNGRARGAVEDSSQEKNDE